VAGTNTIQPTLTEFGVVGAGGGGTSIAIAVVASRPIPIDSGPKGFRKLMSNLDQMEGMKER